MSTMVHFKTFNGKTSRNDDSFSSSANASSSFYHAPTSGGEIFLQSPRQVGDSLATQPITKGIPTSERQGETELVKLKQELSHETKRRKSLEELLKKREKQILDWLQKFKQKQVVKQDLPKPSAPLTLRELEILHFVAQGNANKQTASELEISIKTVEKHRQNLMSKLGLHETASLTRYAIAVGVI